MFIQILFQESFYNGWQFVLGSYVKAVEAKADRNLISNSNIKTKYVNS